MEEQAPEEVSATNQPQPPSALDDPANQSLPPLDESTLQAASPDRNLDALRASIKEKVSQKKKREGTGKSPWFTRQDQ